MFAEPTLMSQCTVQLHHTQTPFFLPLCNNSIFFIADDYYSIVGVQMSPILLVSSNL